MENINLSKTKSKRKSIAIVLSMVAAFIIMLIIFPNEGKFKYQYAKGSHWMYETLEAPFDFPILKTQTEIFKERAEASSKIIPYYKLDPNVQDEVENTLMDVLQATTDKRTLQYILSAVGDVYTTGIMPGTEVASINGEELNQKYIALEKGDIIQDISVKGLFSPKSAAEFIIEKTANSYGREKAEIAFSEIDLAQMLTPNLKFDVQATKMVKKQAVSDISPSKGMVYTGQLIVTEGELITDDIKQILDSFKAEYRTTISTESSEYSILAGHAIFLLAIMLLLFLTIFLIDVDTLTRMNDTLFFTFVVVSMFIITVSLKPMGDSYLLLVPFSSFALYMGAFFKNRLVCPIYMIALLPLVILSDRGFELYMINLVGGVVAMFVFSFLRYGWKQFLNAVILFVVMWLVWLLFRLIRNDMLYIEENFYESLWLLLNSLFVPATYPIVFLLEKAFGLLSTSTLRELIDINNPVVLEMQQKAPGTFQHSLQVSNLAERAAKAIDANTRLIKVGAMYHDIGKMDNPLCFIENQQASGVSYHANLTPQQSACEILSHVAKGVEIAHKQHIPQAIINFITSHHGTGKVLYFYNQYCNNGGDPANIDEFTYKGKLPETKEEIILMIADSVEAASRSLKDYSQESINTLVDHIVEQKLQQGQFELADISLKEIKIVTTEMKHHLAEIYHSRIVYPERKQ